MERVYTRLLADLTVVKKKALKSAGIDQISIQTVQMRLTAIPTIYIRCNSVHYSVLQLFDKKKKTTVQLLVFSIQALGIF